MPEPLFVELSHSEAATLAIGYFMLPFRHAIRLSSGGPSVVAGNVAFTPTYVTDIASCREALFSLP